MTCRTRRATHRRRPTAPGAIASAHSTRGRALRRQDGGGPQPAHLHAHEFQIPASKGFPAGTMDGCAGRIQGVVATRWLFLFEELSELFARGVPAEAFAGAVVEFVFDGLELGGGVLAEVGALGEVFAEQAVGVLVAAALPGCVGV